MNAPMALFVAAFIAAPAAVVQNAPSTTPAVRHWLERIEVRREKAEALQFRLEKLAQTQGSNSQVPRSIFCPLALEAALIEAGTRAHFVSGTNEEFHLLFSAPGKEQYLDVVYTYNQQGALLLTSIHKLPNDWRVAIQPGDVTEGKFLVLTDRSTQCTFEFDTADPFVSRATASEHN